MRIGFVVGMLALVVVVVLAGGCRGRLLRDREEILYCYPIQCQPAPVACPPATVYVPSSTIQSTPMICCPR